MSNRGVRDPKTGKRVLQFLATSALVVSPLSMMACGGSQGEVTNVAPEEPHPNVAPEEEHTNVAPEEEHTNVAQEPDASPEPEEPHTNVANEGDGTP